jgi:stage II sporulation protein AA (anti-sigma F factor antagonist)
VDKVNAGDQPLDVTTERVGTVDVVRLSGRLDSITADVFDARVQPLAAGAAPQLVLDLTRINYVSSAGLRSLLTLLKQVRAQAGALALAGVHPRVLDILEIAGFTSMFTIAATPEDALARLHPGR